MAELTVQPAETTAQVRRAARSGSLTRILYDPTLMIRWGSRKINARNERKWERRDATSRDDYREKNGLKKSILAETSDVLYGLAIAIPVVAVEATRLGAIGTGVYFASQALS